MSVTVHLPDELARRVEQAAARRQVSAEQVAIEAIESRFPADDEEDPLEAFIGSGNSEIGDFARRHREILAEETAGQSAADV
jgi:predicted transcriptional regulator